MKYSYAVHVLKKELEACEESASRSAEVHFLECNEKRVQDILKALKKLGYSEVTTLEDDPGGSGGGPGEGPGPRP